MKIQNQFVKMLVTFLCVAPLVVACGKKSSSSTNDSSQDSGGSGGGGSGGSSPKSMLSVWNGGNGIWFLDLSNGNLNGVTFTATLTQDTGEVCDYNIQLNGTNSSGTCTITANGSYAGGGSGDPGCSANNVANICGTGTATGTGGYTNTGTAMAFPNNGIPWK